MENPFNDSSLNSSDISSFISKLERIKDQIIRDISSSKLDSQQKEDSTTKAKAKTSKKIIAEAKMGNLSSSVPEKEIQNQDDDDDRARESDRKRQKRDDRSANLEMNNLSPKRKHQDSVDSTTTSAEKERNVEAKKKGDRLSETKNEEKKSETTEAAFRRVTKLLSGPIISENLSDIDWSDKDKVSTNDWSMNEAAPAVEEKTIKQEVEEQFSKKKDNRREEKEKYTRAHIKREIDDLQETESSFSSATANNSQQNNDSSPTKIAISEDRESEKSIEIDQPKDREQDLENQLMANLLKTVLSSASSKTSSTSNTPQALLSMIQNLLGDARSEASKKEFLETLVSALLDMNKEKNRLSTSEDRGGVSKEHLLRLKLIDEKILAELRHRERMVEFVKEYIVKKLQSEKKQSQIDNSSKIDISKIGELKSKINPTPTPTEMIQQPFTTSSSEGNRSGNEVASNSNFQEQVLDEVLRRMKEASNEKKREQETSQIVWPPADYSPQQQSSSSSFIQDRNPTTGRKIQVSSSTFSLNPGASTIPSQPPRLLFPPQPPPQPRPLFQSQLPRPPRPLISPLSAAQLMNEDINRLRNPFFPTSTIYENPNFGTASPIDIESSSNREAFIHAHMQLKNSVGQPSINSAPAISAFDRIGGFAFPRVDQRNVEFGQFQNQYADDRSERNLYIDNEGDGRAPYFQEDPFAPIDFFEHGDIDVPISDRDWRSRQNRKSVSRSLSKSPESIPLQYDANMNLRNRRRAHDNGNGNVAIPKVTKNLSQLDGRDLRLRLAAKKRNLAPNDLRRKLPHDLRQRLPPKGLETGTGIETAGGFYPNEGSNESQRYQRRRGGNRSGSFSSAEYDASMVITVPNDGIALEGEFYE